MKKRNLFIIALSMLLGVSTSSCVRNKIETITPSPTEIDEEPTHYGVNPKTFEHDITQILTETHQGMPDASYTETGYLLYTRIIPHYPL